MKVFIPSLREPFGTLLRDQLDPSIELIVGPDLPDPADHSWIVAGVPDPDIVERSPRLEGIVVPWAGLPRATRELALKYPGIAVHNLHHNASSTAEMALTLLLAATKRVVPVDQALRNHDWRSRYEESDELLLEGRSALILGYGSIGRYLGRYLQALGMHVTGVRRKRVECEIEDGVILESVDSLERLLPSADVVMVCVPGTPETDELLGASELALLPSHATLVNVARGPVVEERALYEALKEGRIGAAGLDVWYQYPKDDEELANTPPSKYPFHELDNVVMSPHRAGHTDRADPLRASHLAALLLAAARGEEVPNRVDPEAGY